MYLCASNWHIKWIPSKDFDFVRQIKWVLFIALIKGLSKWILIYDYILWVSSHLSSKMLATCALRTVFNEMS